MAPIDMRRSCDIILRSRRPPILPFLAPSVPRSWLYRLGDQGFSRRNTRSNSHQSSPYLSRKLFHHATHASSPGSTRTRSPTIKPPPLDPKNGPETNEKIRAEYERFTKYSTSAEMLKEAWAEANVEDRASAGSSALQELEETTKRTLINKDQDIASIRRYDPKPSQLFGTIPPKVDASMKFPVSLGQKVTNEVRTGIMPTQDISKRVVRSRPTVGRTIDLNPERGIDFARGLSLLQGRIAQGKIPQTFNKQRFHERPGLKRKRLKSERWRRYFKSGFDAMVNRVKQMKAQGW